MARRKSASTRGKETGSADSWLTIRQPPRQRETNLRSIRKRRLRPSYVNGKAIIKIRSPKKRLSGSPQRSCPSERNPIPLRWQRFEAILRRDRNKTVSRRKHSVPLRRNQRSIPMNRGPPEQSPTPQLTSHRFCQTNRAFAAAASVNHSGDCHSETRLPIRFCRRIIATVLRNEKFRGVANL